MGLDWSQNGENISQVCLWVDIDIATYDISIIIQIGVIRIGFRPFKSPYPLVYGDKQQGKFLSLYPKFWW